ncbi:hypothetical protein ACOSP7_027539 [Xanthoceras sorbifolium]
MRAAVMTIRIAADKFLFEQFEFVTCCLHDWIYQFWTLLLCYYGSPFILNVVGLKICVCRNQGGRNLLYKNSVKIGGIKLRISLCIAQEFLLYPWC